MDNSILSNVFVSFLFIILLNQDVPIEHEIIDVRINIELK